MLNLTRLTAALTAAAITVLGLSQGAFAAPGDRLIELGEDANGVPAFLELGGGTRFKILQSYGNGGMYQASYRASCGEGRLFASEVAIYGASGIALEKKRIHQEMSPQPGSIAANAMRIVCQNIGANGW